MEPPPVGAVLHQRVIMGRGQNGLIVIMIHSIMAVPVQRPGQNFCQTVRMTMRGDHFGVFVQGLKHGRHMG